MTRVRVLIANNDWSTLDACCLAVLEAFDIAEFEFRLLCWESTFNFAQTHFVVSAETVRPIWTKLGGMIFDNEDYLWMQSFLGFVGVAKTTCTFDATAGPFLRSAASHISLASASHSRIVLLRFPNVILVSMLAAHSLWHSPSLGPRHLIYCITN